MSAEVLDSLINQAIQVPENCAPVTVTPTDGQQAASHSKDLEEIRRRIAEAEKVYDAASRSHTAALAFGIPALIAAVAVLTVVDDRFSISTYFGYQGHQLWLSLIMLTVAVITLAPIYYFIYRKRFIAAEEALDYERQSYVAMRLSTAEGRKHYYREELFRLSSKAARVFFGDEKRFSIASQWSERAGNILDGSDKTANLSVVQSCLNSLSELVAREEREQAEEVRWQKWAITVMLLFIAILVASALFTISKPALLTTKVFGVPLSIMLWGAAGSLAAILYRFYTEQGQIRFAAEFRWLIARPIIGIIMGAVVYLALVSGLVLVADNGTADAAGGVGVGGDGGDGGTIRRMEALWIVSFLAGFSDKFYLGVIDLLVARTVRSQEVDSNTVITEKERIPDSNDDDARDAPRAARQDA